MLCWHWNSLKAAQTRTQITGWFKKPTAHRCGNHTVGRFFIAHWERQLLIPHGSAFAKTKLPVTGLLFFGEEGPPFLSYMFYRCSRAEGVYRSARGCINSIQSLNCFGRSNCVWGLIITNVEKAALTHFTFGRSLRRNRIAPLHNIQGYLFVS